MYDKTMKLMNAYGYRHMNNLHCLYLLLALKPVDRSEDVTRSPLSTELHSLPTSTDWPMNIDRLNLLASMYKPESIDKPASTEYPVSTNLVDKPLKGDLYVRNFLILCFIKLT